MVSLCEKEKVSIIMPSYNTSQYIKESIDSVLSQNYRNWELIIVDDGSTDNSVDVINSYTDKRIKLIQFHENKGAAISRNKALKCATGEWIAFLDSDDTWHPNKLSHQIEFMKMNKIDFSYTDYEKKYDSDKAKSIYVTGPSIVTKKEIYRYDYIGMLTMMYNSERYGLVQIKDIEKNNDYALRLKLFKKDKTKCYLLKENLARYRIREKSISHDCFFKKLYSHYKLFRYCDENSVTRAVVFTTRNLFYGVLKKIKYEKIC